MTQSTPAQVNSCTPTPSLKSRRRKEVETSLPIGAAGWSAGGAERRIPRRAGLRTMAGAAAIVSEVNIYPVKSCRRISLQSARLTATGFEWDRQWCVVNEKGRFLTQRQIPKMALIEPSLPLEALDQNWAPLRVNSALSLRAPGMEPLRILLEPLGPREKIAVSVWEWDGLAFDEGTTASDWFSTFLGKPGTRLVRFDNADAARLTDPDYAVGFKTVFTDGWPLTINSEASVEAINKLIPDEPVPVNRFRQNIVVKGCPPFAEDLWSKFKIGNSGVRFRGVKLRGRCKITTTNQTTAEVGREPLNILKTFRLGQLMSPVPKMKGQIFFAMCVVFENFNGGDVTIAVGDELDVLQKAASVTEVMSVSGA